MVQPQQNNNGIIKKIKPGNISGYVPNGHSGTLNRRLIGPTSGSKYVEIILGEMDSTGFAEEHAHYNLEQAIFILEGTLRVLSNGSDELLEPGDLVFIPKGALHQVKCETKKSRFLVIYAPPLENKI